MFMCIGYSVLMQVRHNKRQRNSKSVAKNSHFEEKMRRSLARESVGKLRWWDINFSEDKDMEDLYRKIQAVAYLVQLRKFILFTEVASVGYSIFMVDGNVNWTLRILLFIFCLLVIPLTYEKTYNKYQVAGDFMLSSVLLIFSVVFLLIAFVDKFDGVPTNGYLLMGILMLLNVTIMFMTGTNWFRKMLIIIGTLIFYIFFLAAGQASCYGVSLSTHYPVLQLIPTKEYFRYNFSCDNYDQFYTIVKQTGFSMMNIVLVVYTGYFLEKQKREEFARKWVLMKRIFEKEEELTRLTKVSQGGKESLRNTSQKRGNETITLLHKTSRNRGKTHAHTHPLTHSQTKTKT